MSIVTVQLGQCGNQVGASFYSLLTEDATRPPKFSSLESTQNKIYEEETIERFFTVKDGQKSNNEGKTLLEAKCVMVDMEPKVIQQIMEMARKSGMIGLFLFLSIQGYGRQFSKFTFGPEIPGGDAKDAP